MVTTTHDPDLGGAPRLIVCFAGDQDVDYEAVDSQQSFFLDSGVTTLGTAEGVDVALDGTAADLGVIEHDEFDEYVYVQHDGQVPARINGQAVRRHPLRTGDRLELGPWTLMYFREEHADHGRPYGGRQGGEGAHQMPQPARSEITSAAEPAAADLRTDTARS